jgi:hypothetical protein
MEFRKTSGAQAAAHRAPLSETEAPQKPMVAPMLANRRAWGHSP